MTKHSLVYYWVGGAILVGMVTYCLGSARQKREYFREVAGAIILDNVEVLFCASENGRNYFAFGEVPFGGFTVAEYIKYKCATVCEPPSIARIKALGLKADKRLKKLSAAEMRAVDFLAATGGQTDSAVVINLDGAKYTRRNAAALARLLNVVGEAYVCVTDTRFARAGVSCKTLRFGRVERGARPSFYAAKRLAKKIGAKKVAVM